MNTFTSTINRLFDVLLFTVMVPFILCAMPLMLAVHILMWLGLEDRYLKNSARWAKMFEIKK